MQRLVTARGGSSLRNAPFYINMNMYSKQSPGTGFLFLFYFCFCFFNATFCSAARTLVEPAPRGPASISVKKLSPGVGMRLDWTGWPAWNASCKTRTPPPTAGRAETEKKDRQPPPMPFQTPPLCFAWLGDKSLWKTSFSSVWEERSLQNNYALQKNLYISLSSPCLCSSSFSLDGWIVGWLDEKDRCEKKVCDNSLQVEDFGFFFKGQISSKHVEKALDPIESGSLNDSWNSCRMKDNVNRA